MRISGQGMWQRAQNSIPGGGMLLSKRPEMFLPGLWPSYFSKAKGCKIWDLDGKKYTDMSLMSVGTNLLGYANEEIDDAVIETINKGTMSTLNCPEEVELAERLLKIHPWADKVKLARTGGEANAIAARIARASSGKDVIAICGYHGWHDWYLAANLNPNDILSDHLLPGLSTNGVPKSLDGSVVSFKYNRIDELMDLFNKYNIGSVYMEVERSEKPNDGFLNSVRKLCNKNNALLVFDECTSGFRENFGGLHLKYGVNPDIAIFGKTLGNGYAISAVIGTDSVMDTCQTSFMSSTFWTERIGPTAAIKTLDLMEKVKSWEKVSLTGRKIKTIWKKYASNHSLDIQIGGLDALASFSFKNKNNIECKTFITQEMLKKNILASTTLYSSTAHSNEDIEKYSFYINEVFQSIAKHSSNNIEIKDLLNSPVCHSGFKRLN